MELIGLLDEVSSRCLYDGDVVKAKMLKPRPRPYRSQGQGHIGPKAKAI